MTIYYATVFFIFGSILGSFFNVVGYRLPKGESIAYPSSHCTKCGHVLKSYELIPILSYLFQGGKCRKCKQKISPFYPIFELISGLLFMTAYLIFGFSYQLIIALIIISLSLIVSVSDYLYMIISDEVIIVATVAILITIACFKGFPALWSSLLNGLIAFILMFLLKTIGDIVFKRESMGGGDIKLQFVFGLILGWPMAIVNVFLASFIALPISIMVLLIKKDNIIPFGPFLCSAAVLLVLTNIDFITLINSLS